MKSLNLLTRIHHSMTQKTLAIFSAVVLVSFGTAYCETAEADEPTAEETGYYEDVEPTFSREDDLDWHVHRAIRAEIHKNYLPHSKLIHHLNLPKHNTEEAVEEGIPVFGRYRIPADGKNHAFKMMEVADIDVTARFTGGRDGTIVIEIHDARGKKLVKKSFSELWKYDLLNEISSETLSFERPRSGSTVLFKIGIEEYAPHQYVQFGLYRPTQVVCGRSTLSKAIWGYSLKGDLSRKNHHSHRADPAYPSTMVEPVDGVLMTLSNIIDMRTPQEIEEELKLVETRGGNKSVSPVVSGPSMKWADGRYEVFRWTWNAGKYDRTWPEWGYIAFDHGTHAWKRLCAFRITRDDYRPAAWLFKNGLFAVTNGFCSDLRVYRLTAHRGVQSFRIPHKDIKGHMMKIARLFKNRGSRQEYPRVKPVAEAKLAVTDIKTAGPYGEDIDIACEIETTAGEIYDTTYTVRNGRLIGTSATRRNLRQACR